MASRDHHIAYWQVPEERTVDHPDGSTKLVKMSRAYWGCFDFLVEEVGIAQEKLVELAEQKAKFQGLGFDKVFPDAMAYMDQEYSKKMGLD